MSLRTAAVLLGAVLYLWLVVFWFGVVRPAENAVRAVDKSHIGSCAHFPLAYDCNPQTNTECIQDSCSVAPWTMGTGTTAINITRLDLLKMRKEQMVWSMTLRAGGFVALPIIVIAVLVAPEDRDDYRRPSPSFSDYVWWSTVTNPREYYDVSPSVVPSHGFSVATRDDLDQCMAACLASTDHGPVMWIHTVNTLIRWLLLIGLGAAMATSFTIGHELLGGH